MTKGGKLPTARVSGVLLVVGVVSGLVVSLSGHHRSDRAGGAETPADRIARWRGFAAAIPGLPADDQQTAGAAQGGGGPLQQVGPAMEAWRRAIDRKSTRLNTSHSC